MMKSVKNANHDENISEILSLLQTTSRNNRRLERPKNIEKSVYDSWLKRGNGIIQNGIFPTMIPIPPEDARILGLRIPGSETATKNNEKRTKKNTEDCRTKGESSEHHSFIEKQVKQGRKMNENSDSRGNRISVQNLNKTAKKDSKLKSTRENGALQKENLKSFQARLERGLKTITNKTAGYRKGKSKSDSSGKNVTSQSTKIDPIVPDQVGKVEEIVNATSLKSEKDIGDKISTKTSAKSMRQLFSMADSWSSDSVASHSNSCTCCVVKDTNRRQPPCPVHGASSSFVKKQ